MTRLLFNLAFDAIIWTSLWAILTGHSGAEYGQNFIMFYCWTTFIFSIICMFQVDACIKEFKKQKKQYKYHKLYTKWSSFVEAFAIAILGFPITAFFYMVGAILFASIHDKAEKAKEDDESPAAEEEK